MWNIIIILVYSAINCFLQSPRTGANPWSWGTRGLFYLMDRNLLSMCAVPRRMIVCSSFILLVPGIFPKFWSIPSLIIPSAPTITGTVSVLIPHILAVSISRSLYFESFYYYYYYYYYYYWKLDSFWKLELRLFLSLHDRRFMSQAGRARHFARSARRQGALYCFPSPRLALRARLALCAKCPARLVSRQFFGWF